jgi:uncharacterized protein YuzE
MRIKYDRTADAVYVYLSNKKYAYGKDLDDSRRVDYAADDTPIGIELLCVTKGVNSDVFLDGRVRCGTGEQSESD